MDRPLTKEQFIAYWTEPQGDDERSLLEYMEESIADTATQYYSEMHMFGDAGPGQAVHLADSINRYAKVIARLRYLGVNVRQQHFHHR